MLLVVDVGRTTGARGLRGVGRNAEPLEDAVRLAHVRNRRDDSQTVVAFRAVENVDVERGRWPAPLREQEKDATSPPEADGAIGAPDDGSTGGDGGADGGVDACTCAAGCNGLGQCLSAVTAMGVGRDHHCILRGDGRTFCIGQNWYGQLASTPTDGSTAYVPVVASDTAGNPLRFMGLSSAGGSNCGLTLAGDLYCWGANHYSQLGHDRSLSNSCVNGIRCTTTPVKVELGGLKVKEFSVGSHRTCAIVDVPAPSPNVRCWGYGGAGEWGTGFDPGADAGPDAGNYDAETTAVPQVVFGLRAKAIHANDTDGATGGRVCALSESDIPYCWGSANNRELGNGATQAGFPRCTVAPNDFNLACVLAPRFFATAESAALGVGSGLYHTCALLRRAGGASAVECRTNAGIALPVGCVTADDIFEVTLPAGVDAKRLAVGIVDTCIVDAKDELYCFGNNSTMQLGRVGSDACGVTLNGGTDRRASVPVRVDGPDGLPLKVDRVAVGVGNVIVSTKAGHVVGWGWGRWGVIGDPPDAEAPSASCNTGANGQCSAPREIPLPAYP